MPLHKLQFKPGVDRESTSYAREGGWRDSDKIRFRAGNPEKIGGWDRYITDAAAGVPRKTHVWRTLDGSIYTAIVTSAKFYVEIGGLLYDVTPLRATGVSLGTNPFTTGAVGSKVVTVAHTSHGAINGDYVTFAGATATDGIPTSELNANHEITYVNTNSYTITVTTGASSGSTAGGGGSVTADYEITIGDVNGTYAYGYGTSTYSASTYGTARPATSVILKARTWSLANWGEDLLVNPSEEGIYLWDATNPSNRAVIISNAPTKVNRIQVTKDRHLIAFGCNDPANSNTAMDTLQVRWSHQENYTDWVATIVNTAGNQLLTGGTEIISAAAVEGQTIVWTDDDVYAMQYLGPPYTFGFQQIGTGSGLIGPHAWIAYNNDVYWMGKNAFYIYSGGVSPLPCTVHKFVFDGLSDINLTKVFAGITREFNEIAWFYPTKTVEASALNGAITASDTTILLDTTAGFPTSGDITIESETISYTSKNDTQLLGCTRGVGSTAAVHADGIAVSSNSTYSTNEPSRYAAFNVQDGTWWIGRLERCTWMDKGVLKYPIAADVNGNMFNHEKGTDAESRALSAFIESSDFDLGEGDRLLFINRLIPDFTIGGGSVDLTFKTRHFAQSDQVSEVVGTVTLTTERVDTRIRGRQASLRVENDNVGDTWKYGATRIDMRPDGRR
jgi:hypothetical protein